MSSRIGALCAAVVVLSLLVSWTPPVARGLSAGSRVPWLGQQWYLQGANVPWFDWSCDFGCGKSGGVSDPSVSAALSTVFSQAETTGGVHAVRWWMFEGSPWQITTDSSGTPTGINPSVYTDIDAALQLGQSNDLYFDFVLFSAPSAVPAGWLTNPTQRAALASVLGTLFAHYKDNPRVLSWEVFNEPEWDIWNGKVAEADVQAVVKSVAAAVHANSSAYVTVGSATLEGLPIWVGLGLDYYEAHWYDPMSSGDSCAICTDYQTVKSRYNLDAPLVIGEFYAGPPVNVLQRLDYFYANGYAGAWAWSLLPSHTSDAMAIDLVAAGSFAAEHPDTGPRAAPPPPAPPPPSTTPRAFRVFVAAAARD